MYFSFKEAWPNPFSVLDFILCRISRAKSKSQLFISHDMWLWPLTLSFDGAKLWRALSSFLTVYNFSIDFYRARVSFNKICVGYPVKTSPRQNVPAVLLPKRPRVKYQNAPVFVPARGSKRPRSEGSETVFYRPIAYIYHVK